MNTQNILAAAAGLVVGYMAFRKNDAAVGKVYEDDELTSVTWLNGKWSKDIEINTRLPYVAIYDFFAQGDDADNVINEINQIYNREDVTVLQAAEKWASSNL